MSKSQDAKKETKKKPQKSIKEKRAEKKAKKSRQVGCFNPPRYVPRTFPFGGCPSDRVSYILLLVVGSVASSVASGLFTAVFASGARVPSFSIEVEGGGVWQTVNDVQIPNDDTATRFSLVDVVGEGAWTAGRLYATWNISESHGVRLLFAPLSITEVGSVTSAVDFAGASFSADAPLEATYKFNSWRASYRYRFHSGERWAWWIGFTAKIRDAKVRLEQESVAAEKTDVGFVPLLHIAGTWRFADRWSAELDLDALAGGPGRAEDGSLKLRYRVSDRWSVCGGYRTVEGGADVDEVYNFAWLHYAVASTTVAF